MTDQLSPPGIALPAPDIICAERFDECRRRVAEGCGGCHKQGPEFSGLLIWRWVCCTDCPNRTELNPWSR